MSQFKFVSCKYAIAKIYRDLGLEDPNYEADIIEWMGEALEYIGSYPQLELKNEEVVISSFKGVLPTDFVQMQQVVYEKEVIDYNPTTFLPETEDSPSIDNRKTHSWAINEGYIITSLEEGTFTISYLAIPTDDDGYPLMPDNQYFKEALFWYCTQRLIMRGYKPKVEQITFEYARNEWQYYCTAARNKANFPDLSEYERFKDAWVGLVPSTGSVYDRGFDIIDEAQITLEEVQASNLITTPNKVDNA